MDYLSRVAELLNCDKKALIEVFINLKEIAIINDVLYYKLDEDASKAMSEILNYGKTQKTLNL